ncbi:hypothetical protein EW146_g5031 [Bondarzewia mesenterica]|uniref:Meiotically up-regulated protein Msb1/Mug8 domain-containing protein n=1 Tax=Bondarzewia mesenterica TaxID=1095465 RepID=A0A4S4LTB1_9AGAM|nr:hypothetical protein EW146_g5031 [Bondarzewia mesenterica]
MPSLFSRARTTSTTNKANKLSVDDISYDEFGRVSSRNSNRGVVSLTGRKDNKKEKDSRSRTFSTQKGRASAIVEEEEPQIPDGSFLTLSLEPPRRAEVEGSTPREREQDYGFLSYQRHIVLGLEEADRLVCVVTDELASRGLTTPFIFSSLALDVGAVGVRRLVQAFLRTCVSLPAPDAERNWLEEARIVRIVGGHPVRGLVGWENYLEWSEAEAALNYPATHFATFLVPLQPTLRSIIINVLTILTRFTAHSASSGHTPPTLSPLFGPLMFGLGSAALAFHHTYVHYLRATNAMEHLLLAFVRWQDAPISDSNKSIGQGSAASLGVPTRLKDWIRGYPAMLPSTRNKKDRLQPRRGARTIRVVSVRRNVRLYTPDLVKTAAGWGIRNSQSTNNGLASSREWERIAPPTFKLSPRYADDFKKRMNLPANIHPYTGAGTSSVSVSTSSSTASSTMVDDKDYLGRGKGKAETNLNEERFRSLTDLKWGEFEAMGFGGLGADEKKLQFDLTESARTSRAAKRQTLTWSDFSASGFSRTDAPLNATLQFSTPVATSIQTWPTQQAEMTRKLKKTQQALPPFGWDTEPVMGSEEVIEEAFIDVFCDLVYGGGWMDMEREEEVDRECNWALVEFKALPVSRSTATPGGSDPRTSSILFLFEEFVPAEYRQQLSVGGQGRRRLASLFSPNKSKQWKPAATLNGRPYVVGHVPKSPSYREVEFEGLIRGNASQTKVLTLDEKGGVKASVTTPPQTPQIDRSVTPRITTPRITNISGPLFLGSRSDTPTQARIPSPFPPMGGRPPRFRLPRNLTSPNSRKSVIHPSEYENVDFETRLASYSDDELNSGSPTPGSSSNHERRMSKDDAWVDILVANSGRRLGTQDADLRKAGARPLRGGISDPELASQEVAQALASVRAHPLSDDEDEGEGEDDIEPMRVPNQESLETDTLDEAHTEASHHLNDDEDTQLAVPKKRLGYFDLHPERRPAVPAADDDDPRAHLARDSQDSEDSTPYRDSVGPSQSIVVSDTSDFEPVDGAVTPRDRRSRSRHALRLRRRTLEGVHDTARVLVAGQQWKRKRPCR